MADESDLGPLFSLPPPSPPKRAEPDQAAELARALSQNEKYIMAFLRQRIRGAGGSSLFHGKDVLAYVNERRLADGKVECAPDTPRRLISELQALGCCEVRLLNRRASLYEIVSVSEKP